jgi:hypothetical protein
MWILTVLDRAYIEHLDGLAVVDHERFFAQRHDIGKILGSKDQDAARTRDIVADQRSQLRSAIRIDVCERLVEKEHIRFERQSARER